MRGLFLTLLFWRARSVHEISTIRKKTLDDLGATWRVITVGARTLILSGLIAILLHALDGFYLTKYIHFVPTAIINRNALTAYFTTVLEISAIFVGLYFAALSVVSSTVYAKVPSDVRKLLLNDAFTNNYLQASVFLGALSLLQLLSLSLSVKLGSASLIGNGLLASYVIINFAGLGLRLLDFFSPIRLIDPLNQRLARVVLEATSGGFRTEDAAFQQYYQRLAEKTLGTYRNLAQTVNLKSSDVVDLVSSLLSILRFYVGRKGLIPSESLWFRPRQIFPDWTSVDVLRIQIALQTGTGIAADLKPNPYWIEEEVGNILETALGYLIKRHDDVAAVGLERQVVASLETSGRELKVEEALRLRTLVDQKIITYLRRSQGLKSDTVRQRKTIIFADIVGVQLVSLQVGLMARVREINADFIEGLVAAELSPGRGQRKERSVPTKVLSELEVLQKGLELERAVEGRQVSSARWCEGVIAASIAKELYNAAIAVNSQVTKYPDVVKLLLDSKNGQAASSVLDRGLESCAKQHTLIGLIQAAIDRLRDKYGDLDISISAEKWGALEADVEQTRQNLLKSIRDILTQLADTPYDQDFPDAASRYYQVLAHECYKSLAEDDFDMFEICFPAFMHSCFQMYNRLVKASVEPDLFIRRASEFIRDAFDLSGYSLIYGVIFGKDFWRITKETWISFISNGDLEATYRTLVMLAVVQSDPMMSGRRAFFRSQWKSRMEQKLEELGIVRRTFYSGPPVQVNQSANALLRAIVSNGYLYAGANDVFQAVYVTRFLPVSKYNYSKDVQRLTRRLVTEGYTE